MQRSGQALLLVHHDHNMGAARVSVTLQFTNPSAQGHVSCPRVGKQNLPDPCAQALSEIAITDPHFCY